MMILFNACQFILFFFSLSLSATAETVRGAHRELIETQGTVNLGLAGGYAILAKSGISTVPTSSITGDIGVSPIDATAMTGFSLTLHSGGQHSTSTQFTGKAFAASYGMDIASKLTTAVSNMEAAYTDAAGRTKGVGARLNLGGGTLGGVFGGPGDATRLTTGVYTFGTDVTIDSSITFHGSADDIFIIQMTGNLIQTKDTRVELSGGAKAENIFWQVAGHVKVEAGAHMKGILLVQTNVLFETSSSLSGRVLAQTACNLQKATIAQP
jgi:hypothetical protein